jgi:outer membrane protein
MKKLLLALMLVMPLSVFAQKFGHFNMNEIGAAMPESQALQKDLESKSKVYQDEIEHMQSEFKAKLEDYQKNVDTLVDAVKQRREQELTELQQRIEEYVNKSSQELNELRNQKTQEIMDKILKAVEAVGQEGGYVYIFDINSLPYYSKTLSEDVTAKVKAKLGL